MGDSSQQPDAPSTPPDRSTVILLLADIGDTTWRMFVPTLSLGALGFWADTMWNTEPWLSLAGVTVGIIIAAFLIKQQFQKVKRDN